MDKIVRILLLFVAILGGVFIMNDTVRAESNLEIKIEKSVSMKLFEKKKIKLNVYYQGKDVTKRVRISFDNSDKSIVKVSKINGNNNSYCKGFLAESKKVGKSTITINAQYCPSQWGDGLGEVQEGEMITTTSKCVVKLQYWSSLEVDVEGGVYYNRKNNLFTLKVRNPSKKKIKILSKDAEFVDYSCVPVDRKVRLTGGKSSVTIKPGRSKIVKFKVIGKGTVNISHGFGIESSWRWGGKKYSIDIDDDGCYSMIEIHRK